jgi:hypothetical protein
MSREKLKSATRIFFYLLNNSIANKSESIVRDYIEDNEIRNYVEIMVEEAGLSIISSHENLHLIVKADNSQFATSYTHMKSKYTDLKSKKYFHLANIIISIFISEIDKENISRIRWEEQGITYYKLIDIVSNTLKKWKEKNNQENDFSREWGIDVDEIYNLWHVEFTDMKENDKGDISLRVADTKMSFIHKALKPLKDQRLIIDLENEYRIIPKMELYERLDYNYHNRQRYKEIMKLISESDINA